MIDGPSKERDEVHPDPYRFEGFESEGVRARGWDPRNGSWAGTVAWILAWYAVSISLVLYNKWLFSPYPKGHGFPLPILVTAFHMFTNASFALMILGCKGEMKGMHGETGGLLVLVWVIAPVSLFLGLEIALSNTSFVYLEASFVEMVKPLTLAWTLLLSFGLQLIQPSVRIVFAILLMIAGQVLITYEEAHFVWKGFAIVLLATVMAAFRCVIVQLLLQGRRLKEKLNPLQAMSFIMPGAGAILLIAALVPYKSAKELCLNYPHYCTVVPDGRTHVNEYALLFGIAPPSGYLLTFFTVGLGAGLAILLNLSEFFIIGRNSALTLTIAGFAKLMILFVFTTFWLKESLSIGQFLGLGLALAGVWWYNRGNEDGTKPFSGDHQHEIRYDALKLDAD